MFIFSVLIVMFPFYNYPLFYDKTIFPGGLSLIKLIGGIAVINALAYFPKSNNFRLRVFNANILFLFCFLIWVFINSYIFRDIGNPLPFQSLIAIFVFLFAFVTIIDSEERAKRLIYLYVFAMALACYRTYRELVIYLPIYRDYRPSSTFGDPNYFSLAMIPAISLLIGMIFESIEAGERKKRLLLFIVLLYFLVPFFFAASRGGTIGLLLSLLFIFMASKRKKTIFIAALLLFIVGFPLLQDRLVGRFMTFFSSDSSEIRGDVESNLIRKRLLEGGILIIKEHWLLGIGAGNFKETVAEFVPDLGDRGFIAHNTYVEVFAEHGVIGFSLFIVTVIGILHKMKRTEFYRSGRNVRAVPPLIISLYSGFLGYLVSSLFLSVQYDRMFYLNLSMAILFSSISQRTGKGLMAVAETAGSADARTGTDPCFGTERGR